MEIDCKEMTLQHECQKQMLANMTSENCLSIWNLSKSLPSKNFTNKAKQFVLDNFELVSKHPDFLDISILDLIEIIKDDNLKIKREENMVISVMKWVYHSIDDRADCIADVMQHIRFPLMRPEYLLDLEEEFPLLYDNRKCREILFEALRYRMLGGRRHEITSQRTLHRKCSLHSNVITAIGSDGSCSVTEYKSPGKDQNEWKNIKSLPFIPGYFFAVCTFLDDIYISGGMAYNPSHCAKYNSEQNNWKMCCKMITPRARHAMVAVNRGIFVLGGSTPTEEYVASVDKYDISRQKWIHCSDLLFPVRSMSAAVLKEKIYICGGKQETGKESSVIQCFHSQTFQCSLIGCLLYPVSLSNAIPIDGTIYILSHKGSVMKISPNDDKAVSEHGNFLNFEMAAISVFCFENLLYVTDKIPSRKSNNGKRMRIMNISNGEEYDNFSMYAAENTDNYIEVFKYTIPKTNLK